MKKPRRTIREVCPETGTVTRYLLPASSPRDARQRRHPPAPSKAQKARRRREAALHALEQARPAPPRKTRRPRNDNDVWRQLKREVLAIGRCVCCGKTEDLTVDHIVPLAAGGSNSRRNLQCLCRPCNYAKADRLPSEYGLMLRLAA
jgi:5-methylcytosine-specific restriction endonuclease McrA